MNIYKWKKIKDNFINKYNLNKNANYEKEIIILNKINSKKKNMDKIVIDNSLNEK